MLDLSPDAPQKQTLGQRQSRELVWVKISGKWTQVPKTKLIGKPVEKAQEHELVAPSVEWLYMAIQRLSQKDQNRLLRMWAKDAPMVRGGR